jgi:hypothetical protein
VTGVHNTDWMRRAALAAVIAILCVPAAWGRGQRANAPAPRAAAPRLQNARPLQNRPQYQRRNNQQYQGKPQGNQLPRTAPGYGGAPRAAYPGSARPGYAYPGAAPPGHLGDWLNQHRGLPVQDQERLLRNDPNFNRLPSGDQQRLVQQLHSVNQMPEDQRQRRLARGEAIEHLSPQDRMNLNLSARRLAATPPDRKALIRRAFQDLRGVPIDQRDTMLNSARYSATFSPQERGVLSNLLRVEPYQGP